jgi:hypothetical protein
MELPQEIMLWYVVPGIRRALVVELKKYDLKQKDIAPLLGITEAAISQYMKDKRAKLCGCFEKEPLKSEIKKSAKKILKEKSDSTTISEINRLCSYIKEKKIICQVHMSKDDRLKNCKICYE